MGLQARLAAFAGDVWCSARHVALWPWPATVYGKHESLTHWGDQRFFERMLEPGDFLLEAAERYRWSNKAISGTFMKHLAVYVGSVKGKRNGHVIEKPRAADACDLDDPSCHRHAIVHAVSEGVVCQDLGELLLEADYVAAVRPWTFSHQQPRIVAAALAAVGLEYNFDFKPSGPEAFYCTELGVHCCRAAGIPVPPQESRAVSLMGLLFPLPCYRYPVTLADAFFKYPAVCASVSCKPELWRRSTQGAVARIAVANAPDAENY